MNLDDIKKALVEVKRICDHHKCYDCPIAVDGRCRLLTVSGHPVGWRVDDWEEDDQNA